MHRWQIVALLLCGFAGTTAASGCKDEKSGPGVSDDTAWRIGCTRRGGSCSVAYDRHGGADIAGEIKVSCKREGSSYTIELEDPGTESGESRGRNRSVLEITFGDPEENKCIVGVREYDRSASSGELRFVDECAGNESGTGTCEFEGERNQGGYDFNGSIFCTGMKLNRVSMPDFRLEDANEEDSPVPLQIVNCN